MRTDASVTDVPKLVIAVVAAVLAALAAHAPRAPAAPGTSCGSAATSTTLTLRIAGRVRTAIVHVPSSYTGTTPVPLVLNLHGSGSTATQQELFTGMDATADEHGFLVAYPQASIPDGSGFDWNVPGVLLVGGRPVPRGSADDVAFIGALVSALEHRYCVDAHAVYATGFSGGARLSSELGCADSTLFAAVAPVSGLRHPTPCRAARAVPVLSFHGTADPVDPFAGHGQAYWTYSVATAAREWAEQDGCATKASVSRTSAGVTLTRYARCRAGSTVELYAIAGEGHEWPGGPHLPRRYTVLLGAQSNAIDADETMWAFFARHRLP